MFYKYHLSYSCVWSHLCNKEGPRVKEFIVEKLEIYLSSQLETTKNDKLKQKKKLNFRLTLTKDTY